MLTQKIFPLSATKFQLSWDDPQYKKDTITIDFQTIIDHFQLDTQYQKYCLLHWQAKPFALRRWGIYCRESQTYHGCDFNKVETGNARSFLLQRPETREILPPSAVVCYPDVIAVKENDRIYLR